MSRDKIVIRTAIPDDRSRLSDLIAAAYWKLAEGPYDPNALAAALPLMSRANSKLLASGTYYLADVDGIAVGCGGWTREQPGSSETINGIGHIRHFATHPAYLRQGIARLLLEHCLANARAEGIHTMMSQSTLTAEQFYASAGFRRTGQIKVKMGPDIFLPAIEMKRTLA